MADIENNLTKIKISAEKCPMQVYGALQGDATLGPFGGAPVWWP